MSEHQWQDGGACTLDLSLLAADGLCGMCGCLAREHVGWKRRHPEPVSVPVAFDANGGEVADDRAPLPPDVSELVEAAITVTEHWACRCDAECSCGLQALHAALERFE